MFPVRGPGFDFVTSTPFSEALHGLLRDRLTSFEQLEIVLLLRKNPSQDWLVTTLGEQLHLSHELVNRALASLEACNLVLRSADGASFRFAPSTPALAQTVEELANAHSQHRAALLSTMSVNAIARIRSGPLRAFADAFVVHKGKDNG